MAKGKKREITPDLTPTPDPVTVLYLKKLWNGTDGPLPSDFPVVKLEDLGASGSGMSTATSQILWGTAMWLAANNGQGPERWREYFPKRFKVLSKAEIEELLNRKTPV